MVGKIKKILVEGVGWLESNEKIHGQPTCEIIIEMETNGDIWFVQGNMRYNHRYVVAVEWQK